MDPMTTQEELMLSVKDIEKAASSRLSVMARDFYNGGARNQVAVAENSKAYAKYRIRPRVLVDVSKADPSATVFGRRIDFPVCVSPTAAHGLAHPDGELATSRACGRRNVHMGVSTFVNNTIEDIRAAGLAGAGAGAIEHAMQMYTMKDRALQERIIKRAEAAGCAAILLTADGPVMGVRYNETRNRFKPPPGLGLPMVDMSPEDIANITPTTGSDAFVSDAHSWAREIPWLRSVSRMQVWVKGVLTAEDVELAIQYGCDGVIVSNHGGRQLDEAPATIDALPECVKAANGKIRVHIDGGIRNGADIFKALALGAECVWIGRPPIWGLAYDGEEGVKKVLDLLYAEFKHCMQLAGCNSIADISRSSLGVVSSSGPLIRL